MKGARQHVLGRGPQEGGYKILGALTPGGIDPRVEEGALGLSLTHPGLGIPKGRSIAYRPISQVGLHTMD